MIVVTLTWILIPDAIEKQDEKKSKGKWFNNKSFWQKLSDTVFIKDKKIFLDKFWKNTVVIYFILVYLILFRWYSTLNDGYILADEK